ncbi:O-antigen ligase family protein [Candidatus Thiodiazotropha sp. CDECU1]|uniref:O-antigen ligase family protein n=1 Tax=Candidatus Thiodiazotropha sp. CDECU1 TaxID=3065865 RepID=UPI0029300216|nr:O-antigen ligase family protein [Candidatus Thiodiazotropha sp. CDECU1]
MSTFILSIALLTGGISWVPIIVYWGINIDVDNLGRLFTIAMLPLLIFQNGFKIRIDSILIVLFLWVVWTAVLMNARTGTDGIEIIRMWLVETVFAYTILNCNIKSIISLKVISILSVFVLSLVFVSSAYFAGIDLIGDTLNYILTQDRSHFLYYTLKSTFNAFSPFVTDIDEYNSAVINKLAASYSLLYTVLLFMPKSNSSIINKMNTVAIGLSTVFILLLFSTSSVLMFLFSTLIYAKLRLKQNKLGVIIIMAIIGFVLTSIIIVFAGSDIVDYILYQLDSDIGSRQGRILQYTGALRYIQQSPIFGIGYVTFDGSAVHNWLLFSWIAGGIVSVLLSIIVYFLITAKVVSIKNKISKYEKYNFDLIYLLTALSFIFFVRTMVGGAGGVASGAGMFALAIFLLLSKTGYVFKSNNTQARASS